MHNLDAHSYHFSVRRIYHAILHRTNTSLPRSISASRTSSLPTSTVISFPVTSTSATTSYTVSSSATATSSFTPTTTSSSPTSSNSNYNYLSTFSSLLLNSASPTVSQTNSNPDQAPTTYSLLSVVPTAAPSAPPLPSGLPRYILPQPVLDVNSLPTSDTLINVLFNDSLNWAFVAGNADSAGQIFEYFPTVIATALAIDGMFFQRVLDHPPN